MCLCMCLCMCLLHSSPRPNRWTDRLETLHEHRGTSRGWHKTRLMRVGSRGAAWETEKERGGQFLATESWRKREVDNPEVTSSNPSDSLKIFLCFFINFFRFSHLELVYFWNYNEENIKTLHLKLYKYKKILCYLRTEPYRNTFGTELSFLDFFFLWKVKLCALLIESVIYELGL